MSEDFINKRIFKPFTTTKKKGLGIGLYQCKQIIEAHGGRLEVESQLGEGTTFFVTVQSLNTVQSSGLGSKAKAKAKSRVNCKIV